MENSPIQNPADTTGLAHWMRTVLVEREKTAATFSADAVHDLRVAIRRCRSLAQGFRELDPHPDWERMNRDGRRLFRALGEMRDTQVLIEWVRRLAPEGHSGGALLAVLEAREAEQRLHLVRPLEKFDERRWLSYAETLPWRTQRIALDGPVFEQLALRRFLDARELHRRVLRNRSRVAWHALRIGIKRLRYTIENFLPARHEAWGKSFKKLQDLLGEVHDLDVLWATLPQAGPALIPAERDAWKAAIDAERSARIGTYRAMMVGPTSLWSTWRAGLPSGAALEESAFAWFEAWAAFTDADFPHACHVRGLALTLFDDLAVLGAPFDDPAARRALRLAATTFHVGSRRKREGVAARSARWLAEHPVPLGLTEEDRTRAAGILRLLNPHHAVQDAPPDAGAPARENRDTIPAAVLGLARALDDRRDASVRHLAARYDGTFVAIEAPGLAADPAWGRRVAVARFRLERALGKPIVIPQLLS